MSNEIIRTCLRNGAYTLSVGTMIPAIVFGRLLAAIQDLDRTAHQQIVTARNAFAGIPLHASSNDNDDWWDSDAAMALMADAVRTIERAVVPHQMHVTFSGMDRFEITLRSSSGSAVATHQHDQPGIPPSRVRTM